MIYLQLFISFLQIGMFSFGGGYAAMPLIQGQVVTLHHWLSMEEFTDLITISQFRHLCRHQDCRDSWGSRGNLGLHPSILCHRNPAREALPQIPEHGNAPGNPGFPPSRRGGHDRLRRNLHSHHRLLGQPQRHLPSRHQLESGGDLRDLHGTPPEIQEKSDTCHGAGGSAADRLGVRGEIYVGSNRRKSDRSGFFTSKADIRNPLCDLIMSAVATLICVQTTYTPSS